MKTAYDLNHVKSVSALALLFNGENAGRMVANYSDNPNGSVCTATVTAWKGPLKDRQGMTGRAGGYGYDKLSSAVFQALRKSGIDTIKTDGETCKMFESLGYQVIEVL
jgi:hypothetical protein